MQFLSMRHGPRSIANKVSEFGLFYGNSDLMWLMTANPIRHCRSEL